MAQLPPALADRAERIFGRPVEVRSVVPVGPSFTLVAFHGPGLIDRRCELGQEVELRVSDRAFRHYTPAHWDGQTGEMEIMFFAHGEGPGVDWVYGLVAGTPCRVMGPSGSFRLPTTAEQVICGDATAVGLLRRLDAQIPPSGPHPPAAVEVPAQDATAVAALLPRVEVLTATSEPGAAQHEWLARRPAVARAALVGHAQTLQLLRRYLVSTGTPRRSVTCKPFWSTGRTGL